jgi:hypothetical protein
VLITHSRSPAECRKIDHETEKEARAHKGCRAIQEEEEEERKLLQFPKPCVI